MEGVDLLLKWAIAKLEDHETLFYLAMFERVAGFILDVFDGDWCFANRKLDDRQGDLQCQIGECDCHLSRAQRAVRAPFSHAAVPEFGAGSLPLIW